MSARSRSRFFSRAFVRGIWGLAGSVIALAFLAIMEASFPWRLPDSPSMAFTVGVALFWWWSSRRSEDWPELVESVQSAIVISEGIVIRRVAPAAFFSMVMTAMSMWSMRAGEGTPVLAVVGVSAFVLSSVRWAPTRRRLAEVQNVIDLKGLGFRLEDEVEAWEKWANRPKVQTAFGPSALLVFLVLGLGVLLWFVAPLLVVFPAGVFMSLRDGWGRISVFPEAIVQKRFSGRWLAEVVIRLEDIIEVGEPDGFPIRRVKVRSADGEIVFGLLGWSNKRKAKRFLSQMRVQLAERADPFSSDVEEAELH